MNFAWLAPMAWDNSGGAHRPVQFASELARRGHAVTYVEIEKTKTPPPESNPRLLNLEDLGWDELELLRAWYGFDYAAPLDAPARLFPPAGELPSPADSPGVVVCAAPFRPLLNLLPALAARGWTVVYDVLDDIDEMRALGSYCYDALAESYLAQNADLVVALSPRLSAKFRDARRVALIRDGVDLAPFRTSGPPPALPTLARGERTIGFWGTMWDYNVDVPLLQALSRARPTWTWHLIGAYDLDPARPSLAAALAAPNVYFHPSVPRAGLLHLARAFDACILPTPVTPFNLARDPLKVYEYLACYKPVVATALEQLAGMPYVHLARDAGEFLDLLEAAVHEPVNHAALDAYLAGQTWARRTDALLEELVGAAVAPRGWPDPPRGAMPGAADEADRLTAYARHLERLVRDREAHVRELEAALGEAGLAGMLNRALRPKAGRV